ncbi:hemicentin-2-like isoform X1 [Neodiprion fabricii]|uniref:hemicentin-2-like isoform X1 n=2 Tax=Neodiprion fabricii TaxID=2872261 RepID=UPI001ED8EEC1|nr:hemicentin-2-like isoform X1 [Neodiprion fabricii]
MRPSTLLDSRHTSNQRVMDVLVCGGRGTQKAPPVGAGADVVLCDVSDSVIMRACSYVNYYVLCLVCWILLGITGVSTRSHSLVKRLNGLYTGPYFDTSSPQNITAQLGTHAYLPCKVRQLGNKSVSWIRKRDAHILTVDRYTFIADERFQAFYLDGQDTWTLQVKYVQPRDAGEYECQVSTEPKMSYFIKLNVVVPKIEIMGDRDIYVKTGSTVTLRCVIKQSLEEPSYVFWYHESGRVLIYQQGKLEMRKERVDSDTVSSLIIHTARREDSGNYTCSPSNLDSASVQLHVLNGEHPAAIQRGISSAPGGSGALWWLGGAVTLSSSHGERTFILAILVFLAVFVQTLHSYSGSLR